METLEGAFPVSPAWMTSFCCLWFKSTISRLNGWCVVTRLCQSLFTGSCMWHGISCIFINSMALIYISWMNYIIFGKELKKIKLIYLFLFVEGSKELSEPHSCRLWLLQDWILYLHFQLPHLFLFYIYGYFICMYAWCCEGQREH